VYNWAAVAGSLDFLKSSDGLACRVAATGASGIGLYPPLTQPLEILHTLLNLIGVFKHNVACEG
jgi:hypothetical protein